MKAGIIVPQGWTGDYDGWDAAQAWARTVAVARQAERLGFESIWLFDHFTTVPRPTDEITFESFTSLTALAALTSRVRLGHIVICTAFRNPGLTAKMISTMDVISGGRMELGIGAGWKRDEWLAYGYGFPSTGERLAALGDHLAVITAMLEPGRHVRATAGGPHASVKGAINLPKPLQQPRVPRHGRRQRPQRHLAAGRPLRRRAEPGRPVPGRGGCGPARHPLAVRGDRPRPGKPGHQRPHLVGRGAHARPERIDVLAGYREIGVRRTMQLLRESATSDEALESYAEDVRAAGVELAAS